MDDILEPNLLIIDPHHHLWDNRAVAAQLPPGRQHLFLENMRRHPLYLLDELLADLDSGHNIRATIYIDVGGHFRTYGPVELRPVGETEYVVGVQKQAAARGRPGVCAAIVGRADLTLGDKVAGVLEAHLAAGEGRLRGVRQSASWDADPTVLGPLAGVPEGRYRYDAFRAGFARLAPLGLSFDALLLEPQLGDLVDLARAFPDTSIVLNHVGHPLGLGGYANRLEEFFPRWRGNMAKLAECTNVTAKLGGFAIGFAGPSFLADPPAAAEQLASEWRRHVETAIELFGANRCMFESNFPVDAGAGSYRSVWNAYKLIAKDYTVDEKRELFAGTAARTYQIAL